MQAMKVAYQTGIGEIKMGEGAVPQPGAGQVQVRIMHTGVCGSDLHYYEQGRIGDYIVEYPFILGHESAGVVTEVGEGVTCLAVGDRVALEPGYTCGRCEFCKTGRYNLCPDVIFFATPPIQGTLQEYVVHPADMCFKLPESVSTLEGALIEPLAVGFHGAAQGGARPGLTAAVLGCGCIGLVTLMALHAYGVHTVYMSDMIDVRRRKAGELGATAVFDGREAQQAIEAATGGQGVDLVIETAGSRAATASTVDIVKKGGTIVLVGLTPDPVVSMNLGRLINKEASIRTVFRYRNLYPVAISAVAGGLPIGSIVSDTFTFDETPEAFRYSSENKNDIVKTVIAY